MSMSRRHVGTVATIGLARGRRRRTGSGAGRDRDLDCAVRRGSVAMPTRAQDLALRVRAERRAEQPIDPRRPERDAARLGLLRVRVDRAAAPRCRRPTPRSRRAARSAPRRASRNSWPFSKRRLASERSA